MKKKEQFYAFLDLYFISMKHLQLKEVYNEF